MYLSQYASDWDVSGDGQFSIIYNLGIGKDGLIYVPDMQNGRIVVLQDDDYVAPIDLDSDKDGVLDTIENAGPNNGDANNDGILDKYQTKVTTYKIDGTDSYTTLVNGGCSENSSVSGLSVSSLSATDSGFDYPFGLTEFSPGFRLKIDLPQQQVARPDGHTIPFEIDAHRKESLINGWDDIGRTLLLAEKIREFEERRKSQQPWLFA